MKISFEIPDPTPAPEPKDRSTPKAVSASDETTAPPSPPTTKRQSAPVADKVKAKAERTTPVPPDLGASKDQAKQPEEEKPSSQSAVSNNPLHSFDLQGGVNDILDPGRGNPNVYQFVQPKGEA